MPASPVRPDSHSLAGPVFLWLLVNLLPLTVGALRIPLAARLPPPMERLTLPLLLATQTFAAAILFPWLLRSPRAAIATILCSIPFIHFAALLSGTSLGREISAGAVVVLWITALAVTRAALEEARQQRLAAALATVLVAAAPILFYLHVEFGAGDLAAPHWRLLAALSPMLGALSQLSAPEPPAVAYLPVSLWLAAASVAVLRRRLVDRHKLALSTEDSTSTSYPPS